MAKPILTEIDFQRAAKKLRSNVRPRNSALNILNVSYRNAISFRNRFFSFAQRESVPYVQHVHFFQFIYKRIFTASACFRAFIVMMFTSSGIQSKFLSVGRILSRRNIFQVANMIVTWIGINVIYAISLRTFAKKHFSNQSMNKVIFTCLSLMAQTYSQISTVVRLWGHYFSMGTPFERTLSTADLSVV